MTQKEKKAKEVYTLVAELNRKIKEARDMGLAVEVKPTYGPAKAETPIGCKIGEYIPYKPILADRIRS